MTALEELADARAAIAKAASRFGANVTPATDAKAAADPEELPIDEALTSARECLAAAALLLWQMNDLAAVRASADLTEHRQLTRLGTLTIMVGIVLFAALQYWPPGGH